jgi:hypothetical protein
MFTVRWRLIVLLKQFLEQLLVADFRVFEADVSE